MVVIPKENVVYGGLLPRGIAYLIDCVIAFGLFIVTQLLVFSPIRESLGMAEDWFRSGVHTEFYTLLTISIPIWLYFALFEQSFWQATPESVS